MTSPDQATVPGPATRDNHRWRALVVLCFVHFMLVLDDTVVNVALPSVRDDLGFSTAGLAWVVNAYFLSFGGLLLLFGRAGDLLGRRRLFLSGVALFATASLACGLAQEPWQLVVGRFGQGTGAAMTSPAALALITLLFPGERERARALSIWGASAGLGGTTGLVISGALTGLASWRWIFFVNLPIAALALVLIPRLVAESRARQPERLDVAGAVLGTAALVSLVYGLLEAAATGWGRTGTTVPLVLAAALAGAFAAVEARAPAPLVPRSFLASRVRVLANAISLPFTAAFFSMSFLLMLHMQTVLGYDPLTAGLAYLPYGAGILIGVAVSSVALPRIGVRATLVSAFLVAAAGLLLLAGVSPDDHYATDVLPGLLVAALGSGVGFAALTVAAMTGTTRDDAALGSAVLTTVQQVGGAVGLSVLAGLAVQRSESLAPRTEPLRALTEGYSLAFSVAAALLALGAALAVTHRVRRAAR